MTTTAPALPLQQPPYDREALDALPGVRTTLAALPPLVFAGEVDTLSARLADVCAGRAFLLQGGDCAETFATSTAESIRMKVQTILQMGLVLTYGAGVPVVRVGRIAGQYAKPRSADLEMRDSLTLPSYRGDAVNSEAFTPEARRPDPARLLDAYHSASATLNLVRAFTSGGYADLEMIHGWNRGFSEEVMAAKHYRALIEEIDRAVAFMSAWSGTAPDSHRASEFYASHEALLVDYEEPMVRVDSRTGRRYLTSTHLPWIGERTRDLHGYHVGFLASVMNPVAVKIGPSTTVPQLFGLADRLNPSNTPGRLTFITRMGATEVSRVLPPLLQAARTRGINAVWSCDPMHGNTQTTSTGIKTRAFDDICDEVQGFFEAHRQSGTWPGGLHIEMTGDDVTECIGGMFDLDVFDLEKRYESLCDPRLNREQSTELAFAVAEMLSGRTR